MEEDVTKRGVASQTAECSSQTNLSIKCYFSPASFLPPCYLPLSPSSFPTHKSSALIAGIPFASLVAS